MCTSKRMHAVRAHVRAHIPVCVRTRNTHDRLDCSSDADCAKYSSSSPKYTQGAAHQCPYTDGWGREACVHHVAPTPDPPTPFPSPLPTTTAIPTTFLPSLPPTAPVPPTSVPSLSPTTGCVTWRKCAHLAQDETFCVGCEDALIYCYGSPDGCLWGRCTHACTHVHCPTCTRLLCSDSPASVRVHARACWSVCVTVYMYTCAYTSRARAQSVEVCICEHC